MGDGPLLAGCRTWRSPCAAGAGLPVRPLIRSPRLVRDRARWNDISADRSEATGSLCPSAGDQSNDRGHERQAQIQTTDETALQEYGMLESRRSRLHRLGLLWDASYGLAPPSVSASMRPTGSRSLYTTQILTCLFASDARTTSNENLTGLLWRPIFKLRGCVYFASSSLK